jgi:riboflavin synthase
MFSGIVKSIGKIRSFDEASSTLWVSCHLFGQEKFFAGASIAVDGVCLTVCQFAKDDVETIGFNLGKETKAITLLSKRCQGDPVNIEPALRINDSLDGHLVQGHVDAIVELLYRKEWHDGQILRFLAPKEMLPFLILKGSVAIDGVSLTINEVINNEISVCLVPYTLKHTTLGSKKINALMHMETDMVGRYLFHFYSNQTIKKESYL